MHRFLSLLLSAGLSQLLLPSCGSTGASQGSLDAGRSEDPAAVPCDPAGGAQVLAEFDGSPPPASRIRSFVIDGRRLLLGMGDGSIAEMDIESTATQRLSVPNEDWWSPDWWGEVNLQLADGDLYIARRTASTDAGVCARLSREGGAEESLINCYKGQFGVVDGTLHFLRYVADEGIDRVASLNRLMAVGAAPEEVYRSTYLDWTREMLGSGEAVYWLDTGGIQRNSQDGGTKTLVPTLSGPDTHITVDGETLYFVTNSEGGGSDLRQISATGGVPTTITTVARGADRIAADGEYVYLMTSMPDEACHLLQIKVADGSTTELASMPGSSTCAEQLAVDMTSIYVLSLTNLVRYCR